MASGQPKTGRGHADSSSPLVIPPSDQFPGNGHGGQQLKGPAALPCRLSRLRNIGQRQCRRHGISLLPWRHGRPAPRHLSPARPPRIASAPGSLQANGSHSCCVQTPRLHADHPKSESPSASLGLAPDVLVGVQSLVAVGLFGCPRLRLSDATLAHHPHLPAAVFVPFSAVVVAPTPSPARPEKEAVRSSKIQVSAMGAGAGVFVLGRVPLKQIARGASNRICPIVSPGPRDRRSPAMATLPTCSVSRAPKPALDWQPVAERQRQRDLQEGRVEKRRGRSHTHVLFPPNQHHVAEKGWEPGRSRGNCPWTYRRPPSFSSQPRRWLAQTATC